MRETTINGLWTVASTTDSIFAAGMTVTFTARSDGLAIESLEGTGSVTPWQVVRHTVSADGQSVVDTAGGTIRLRPIGDARASDIGIAIAARREAGEAPRTSSPYPEFAAGEGQVLVLYRSGDTGDELDPAELLAAIAADAALRLETGWRMTSMVTLPLRHAGQKAFAVEGSGYTTKAVFGVLYTLDTGWLGMPGPMEEPR
jgi:hypothetical protein